MKSKIYSVEDKEWFNLVSSVNDADIIFYLPEYFTLLKEHFKYKAELFFYGDNKDFIIFPYFKKCINDLNFYDGQTLYDITTPEYGGPILVSRDYKVRDKLILSFLKEFGEYCRRNNIVTEFTRLHPFIENHKILHGAQNVKPVYYIDLTKDLAEIKSDYNKQCRNSISKAIRECVIIEFGSQQHDIINFYNLYVRKMEEFNANDYYYYSEEYMLKLLKYMNFNSVLKVFTAKINDKIIASSIFIGYKDYLYYYLSCSDRNYSKYNGNNLIIDKAVEWAKNFDFKYLVLGGYYKDESLAKFKSSFTKLSKDFYRYKTIHNKEKYFQLLKMRKDYDRECNINCDYEYFPEYRAGLE